MHKRILVSMFFLLLSGCAAEENSGPADIRWDRETCTRCNMAIGDRLYAAEIRGGESGQKHKLYKFDDIGCAVLWLNEQTWKDSTDTEIWVIDQTSGNWIDARQAHYVSGKISPMNYGLGAQTRADKDTLDFTQATAHILAIENERHLHGTHNPESSK